MQSQCGHKFRYSGYWRSWSRILQRREGPNEQVEVDLTTINDIPSEWNEVSKIHIRKHCTVPEYNDRIVDELPPGVVMKMQMHLSDEVFHRLMHEDLLPQIDWDKYNKVCNGGACLDQISKD